MDTETIKKKIIEFFKKHNLMVISTIHSDDKRPESAVVAFTENKNLELIFGTSNTTRKYKNLQKNPNVSVVVGWDRTVGTVQYEGIARELSDDEADEYSALHIKRNPGSVKFLQRKDQRYFLIKPKWIRIVDMSQNPNTVSEINI